MTDGKNALHNSPTAAGHARRHIRAALLLFAVFLLIPGIWSVTAKLDSAGAAPGRMIPEGKTRTVTHPDGGVIAAIAARDGDRVEKGDVLIELRPVRPETDIARLQVEYGTHLAAKARLEAERDGFRDPVFPPEADPERVMSEKRLFEGRKEAYFGKRDLYDDRMRQIAIRIDGLKKQRAELQKQLRLHRKSLNSRKALYEEGFATEDVILELTSREAEYIKQLSENDTQRAAAAQEINAVKLQKTNLANETAEKAAGELREAAAGLADAGQRLRAARDTLSLTKITAPVAGIVTGTQFNTVGSSVPPNTPLVSIVPEKNIHTAEVRINPQDIDVVREGLDSRIYLSAFKTNKVPPLKGVLEYVSSDTVVDETTGEAYYEGKIRLLDEEIASLPAYVTLRPGMQVEAMIVTGERTPLDYLLSPIKESMRRSFIED